MGLILDEPGSTALPTPASRTLETATCTIGDRQPLPVAVHFWIDEHGAVIVEGATWGPALLERHCFSDWQVAGWAAQIRTQRASAVARERAATQCRHEALLAECAA